MAIVTRGFPSRRREPDQRVPPGQYVTDDFPVLSAGPDTSDRHRPLVLRARHRAQRKSTSWTWRELLALPIDKVDRPTSTASPAGRSWPPGGVGVSLDHLLADAETSALYAMVHSYGGYTTNVPLADLRGGKAWIAFEFDGRPLRPEHGGPARLLDPAPLLLEVGQVGPRSAPPGARRARVLGTQRLQPVRRPVDRGPVLLMASGPILDRLRLAGRHGGVRGRRHGHARVIGLRGARLAGYLPGQHLDLRLTAEDGYQAVRSYSIASYGPGDIVVELGIDEYAEGEVSPYLVREPDPVTRSRCAVHGRYFVWSPETER